MVAVSKHKKESKQEDKGGRIVFIRRATKQNKNKLNSNPEEKESAQMFKKNLTI